MATEQDTGLKFLQAHFPRKGTCSRSFSLKIQKKILRHHWVKSLGSCHRKLLFSWILLSFHNLTFTNCLQIFLLKGYTIGPSKTCESTRSQLVIKIQDVGTKAAQVTIGSLFCRTRKKQLHDYWCKNAGFAFSE